jgi:hypothetical protein
MFQPTSASDLNPALDGDLVVHGDQATLFGPVGAPVPSSSRMGVPQAASRVRRPAIAARAVALSGDHSEGRERVALVGTAAQPGLRLAAAGGR